MIVATARGGLFVAVSVACCISGCADGDSRDRYPCASQLDPATCHELQHALAATPHLTYDNGHKVLNVPGEITPEEFRRRSIAVPGWDVIAAVCPYGRSDAVAADPMLRAQGADLCACMQAYDGFGDDGVWDLTIIRGGSILGHFWVQMNGPPVEGFVVSRDG